MKFYNYDIISLIILIIGCLSLYFGNIRHCIGKFWLYCLCGLTAAYLILMISFSHANHFFSGDFYCSNSLLVFSLYIGYIILLPGFLYMFFASLCKQPVNHPVLVFLPCVLEFLLLLSNPVTHFYFYFTASGLYQMSLGVFILYLTNLIYCFLIFGFTLYHKKRLGNRIFTAFEILALFEIGVQVLQLFLRYTIFEGLAISIGLTYVMIIYYLADNPQNSLTGVYNRDAFYRAAAELIAQNPHEPYLLVRIDIYHFQDVNERFGYETGDLLIQKVADDLKQKLPYSCDIGYLGADDFVICMPEKDIPIFPTHMDLSCISPSVKRSHDIYFSVGVFHVNDRFMDISLMLDRAQFALNSIKNSYQTRIHVFTNEDEQKFQLENYMLHEMFHALNDHAFQIYIQPICDAASGKIVSGEVLVR